MAFLCVVRCVDPLFAQPVYRNLVADLGLSVTRVLWSAHETNFYS